MVPEFPKIELGVNFTESDIFDYDLELLLNACEMICRMRMNHVDYVKAVIHFKEKWRPKNDS